MRKSTKLMAGLGVVAGLGVALAPLATFAIAAGDDDLTVNVTSSCAIAADATTSDQIIIDGEWAGTGTPGQNVPLTGTGETADASHEVAFSCSENSKVSLSASTTGLASTNDTIAAANITASYTGTNVTFETAFASSAYGALGSDVLIGTGTADSNGDISFTVAGYKALLKANQKPGEYNGTVTYSYLLVNE